MAHFSAPLKTEKVWIAKYIEQLFVVIEDFVQAYVLLLGTEIRTGNGLSEKV